MTTRAKAIAASEEDYAKEAERRRVSMEASQREQEAQQEKELRVQEQSIKNQRGSDISSLQNNFEQLKSAFEQIKSTNPRDPKLSQIWNEMKEIRDEIYRLERMK